MTEKMKRDRGDFFFSKKNVSRPSNPRDEVAENVSKKNPRRTNYSSICSSKVQNLTVFSIVHTIRIRFFGPRELIQNGFRAAQYGAQWTFARPGSTAAQVVGYVASLEEHSCSYGGIARVVVCPDHSDTYRQLPTHLVLLDAAHHELGSARGSPCPPLRTNARRPQNCDSVACGSRPTLAKSSQATPSHLLQCTPGVHKYTT